MVHKVFNKQTSGSGIKSMPNQELAEKRHKPIIRISKFEKGIRFLLCIIEIFSKYVWFVTLKDKKGVTVVDAFQSISNDSKTKYW